LVAKTTDLEALVQLLEERHNKTEELLKETQQHSEKAIKDLKAENKVGQADIDQLRTDLGQVRGEKTI
jgi:predicted  nucleic acid-binding Zn-ribbon protein